VRRYERWNEKISFNAFQETPVLYSLIAIPSHLSRPHFLILCLPWIYYVYCIMYISYVWIFQVCTICAMTESCWIFILFGSPLKHRSVWCHMILYNNWCRSFSDTLYIKCIKNITYYIVETELNFWHSRGDTWNNCYHADRAETTTSKVNARPRFDFRFSNDF